MSRKADLEGHIRESYQLAVEYEVIQRLSSDPKERIRAQRVIKEQKELISRYISEYVSLCNSLGLKPAQNVTEIAATMRSPLSPAATNPKSWSCRECGRANPEEATNCHFCGARIRTNSGDNRVDAVISGARPEGVAYKESWFMDAHALLIGVGSYTHFKYRNLPATVQDVRAIATVLTDPNHCGYSQDNVQVISEEQATADGMRTALEILAGSTSTQSTVMVYFSGHGGRSLENGNWHSYLCPREADPDKLADTAIAGGEFSELLAPIPAQRMLVILDACHAGASAEFKAADGKVIWKAGLSEDYYEALSRGSGRVVMASSKAEQVSYVRPQEDLSVFTWHFKDALRGKAAVRGDGLVHVLDVFHYVNEKVQEERFDQTPILKVTDMDLNFAIALDRARKSQAKIVQETVVADIREEIIRDPVMGARKLSEYLKTEPAWVVKRNEIDLKRSELERIHRELELYGPNNDRKAARNRIIHSLLRTCLELEQASS